MKILIFRIGQFKLGISEQIITRIGRLKDNFVLTKKTFADWKILPLHRFFGYSDFPNSRDYIITLNNGENTIICDELVKIVNVEIEDSQVPVSKHDTPFGEILFVDPFSVTKRGICDFLAIPCKEEDSSKSYVYGEKPIVDIQQAYPVSKQRSEEIERSVEKTRESLAEISNDEKDESVIGQASGEVKGEKFGQISEEAETSEGLPKDDAGEEIGVGESAGQELTQEEGQVPGFYSLEEQFNASGESDFDDSGHEGDAVPSEEVSGVQDNLLGAGDVSEGDEIFILPEINAEANIDAEEIEDVDIFTDYSELGEEEVIEDAELYELDKPDDSEQTGDKRIYIERTPEEVEGIRSEFHIFNLSEHFNESIADEPKGEGFLDLDTILKEDEMVSLPDRSDEDISEGDSVEEQQPEEEPELTERDSGEQIQQEFEGEGIQGENTGDESIFDTMRVSPEFDVDVIIDEQSFENGKLKESFDVKAPDVKLEKNIVFSNISGDKVMMEEIVSDKGGREYRSDGEQKNIYNDEDDDESECSENGDGSEAIGENIAMNDDGNGSGLDLDKEDTVFSGNIEENGMKSGEDDVNLSGVFEQALEHSKTEDAFSTAFFGSGQKEQDIPSDGLELSSVDALDDYGEYLHEQEGGNEEYLIKDVEENGLDSYNFIESDISNDYNGLIEKEKEQNSGFKGQSRSDISRIGREIFTSEFNYSKPKEDVSLEDHGGYSSPSSDAMIDVDKKSYEDRRDDEIEKIRREIMQAREQLGEEEKTNVELLKKVLKSQKEQIEERKAQELNGRGVTDRAKHVVRQAAKSKKNLKKKRSIKLWLGEFFTSAAFKIALILVFVFLISVLGIYFFEHSGNKEMFKNLWDSFWYTIVTFTTVGYGDKYPTTFGGQIVGILMMFVGVTLFGVISGRIASYLVDLQIRRGKGLVKLQRLTNHFVICGWRKDFNIVLDEILMANQGTNNDEIVLINDIPIEQMESVMSVEKYKGINYIRGDFLEEAVLRRANIDKASKVLILADSGQQYSPQEADARTVMAAITIESINKNIYVAAELLDEKFERYLKLAHVEEIILSREYSRRLLATASAATGMSHIVTELISTQAQKGIATDEIPREFIGDTFGSLSMYFLDRDGSILVGILENTGNFYERKKEALVEAQKTSDISKLVENLRTVKTLQANMPIVNPGGDYVIKEHTKAIVVEGISRAEKEAILGR